MNKLICRACGKSIELHSGSGSCPVPLWSDVSSSEIKIEELKKELDLEKLHNLELRNEVNKLKRIILKELNENDELGSEYVYTIILRESLREKEKLINETINRNCELRDDILVLSLKLKKAIKQRDAFIWTNYPNDSSEFHKNKCNKELDEIC